MNLEKLAFHLDRLPPSYCQMFDVEENDRSRKNRYDEFASRIQFYEQRRNNKLVNFVQGFRGQIFKYSLKKLQEDAKVKFPDLDPKIIQEEVKRMYDDAEREAVLIKEQPIITEEVSDHSLLGRNAIMEPSQTERKPKMDRRQSEAERVYLQRYTERKEVQNTERENSDRENEVKFIEDRLNSLLEAELNNQIANRRGPGIILEDDPEDLINRSANKSRLNRQFAQLHTDRPMSLPSNISQDIIHVQPLTARSDKEQLEEMLKNLVSEEQGFSSRRSIRNLKIRKEIMDRMYDYQGRLKMDIVKKVFGNLKKEL